MTSVSSNNIIVSLIISPGLPTAFFLTDNERRETGLWYWVLWETLLYPTGKVLPPWINSRVYACFHRVIVLVIVIVLFIGVFWLPLFIFNRVSVNIQWNAVLRCCLMNRANEESKKFSCGSFLIRSPALPQSFSDFGHHRLVLFSSAFFWLNQMVMESDTALTPQPPLIILALTITLGSHQPLMQAGPQ